MTLRELRIARGYKTETALANTLCVPRVSYTKWELGLCLPNHIRLSALSKALGCTVDDIIEAFQITQATSAKGGITNGESKPEEPAKAEFGETHATLSTAE